MKRTLALFAILALLSTPYSVFAANTNVAVFTNTANKYLSASDSVSLSQTGAVSFQFAVKLGSAASTDSEGIFGYYNANPNRSYFIGRGNGGAGDKIELTIYNSGGSSFSFQSSALTRDAWYCVLITYEPSTAVRIYLDSGCDAEPALDLEDTTGIPADIRDAAGGFYMGAFGAFTSSADNNFDGKLDDLRIWSEVHNDASDYNCEITGTETNLQAYWKLNNSLLDETANNNDLTNTGSVNLTNTDVPFSSACGGGGPAVNATSTTPLRINGGSLRIQGGTFKNTQL